MSCRSAFHPVHDTRRPAALVSTVLFGLMLAGCPSGGGGGTKIECGGGAKFACPSGLYCELGNGCGGIDKQGYCRRIPENCPLEESPVCSCDKHDYRNECYANAAAETVAYIGKCLASGQ